VTAPVISSDPTLLCQAGDILGEGPLWDHRHKRLLWIDIDRGCVHRWSESQGHAPVVMIDGLIGSIALAGADDLLIASTQGILRWQGRTGRLVRLADPPPERSLRYNDGRVDSRGRFWVGTMAIEPARHREAVGELWRLDPDGQMHRVLDGLTIANGLDWSPDGRTFYLTDTMRRQIRAYSFVPSDECLSEVQAVWSTDPVHGYPDGLTVDAAGYVWSAGITGGVLCRYDVSGQLQHTVKLPVSCPTAITFGGDGLSQGFCTTSRHLLSDGHREADAGGLFTFSTSVRGRLAGVFGGVLA